MKEQLKQNKNTGIGASVPRLEDMPLVTGRGQFAADISFPRQLHMRIVRSANAHGVLKSINVDEARALRGVVAVWTARDIADLPPIDFREGPIEKLAPFRQPVLARDREDKLAQASHLGRFRRKRLTVAPRSCRDAAR